MVTTDPQAGTKKRRRGAGEGAIYQRASDGRWVGSVDLGWHGGKRRRRVIYGDTRKEVADRLKELHTQQQAGALLAADRQTVASFLDRWLEDVVKPTRRIRTYEAYCQLTRLYITKTIGHHRLDRLTPQHVQAMMTGQVKAGLSPRTAQFTRAVLRRALGQAVKWGMVPRNVAALVDPPPARQIEITPLTTDQCKLLLDAAKGDRFEALYRLTLSLGLRLGEVLGIRWQDVDLEGKTVRIMQSVQRTDHALIIADLKTERSRRTLPLTPSLATLLKAERANQRLTRLAAGDRWRDHGLVFTSRYGTPIEPRNVQHRFKVVLAQAGLPPIRFHDLRHSAASLLLAQGVQQRVVMEILGHSQIATTMNTYAHVMPEAKRSAIADLDRLLPVAHDSTA